MAERRTEQVPSRPRPRPAQAALNGAARAGGRKPGRGLALPDPAQSGQVVAAAGSAIVTAARVGRLLGRSGWRIAKQLPGMTVVEQQAQKIRHAAASELHRLLDMPQSMFGAASAEEQRVMMLVQNAGSDPEPLRAAMSELLDRSTGSSSGDSRDYLFGTIVSQLVPDEARILAVLAQGQAFAALDVVAKQVGRSTSRTVVANLSTVGDAAGVSLRENTSTYLTRLQGLGLVEFAAPTSEVADQFEVLIVDRSVEAAKALIEGSKQGSARLVRKSVSLTPLGREFWAACAPSRSRLARRLG